MARHRNPDGSSWWWVVAALIASFGIWVYYTLESNGLLK